MADRTGPNDEDDGIDPWRRIRELEARMAEQEERSNGLELANFAILLAARDAGWPADAFTSALRNAARDRRLKSQGSAAALLERLSDALEAAGPPETQTPKTEPTAGERTDPGDDPAPATGR